MNPPPPPPQNRKKVPQQNSPSCLLSDQENNCVFNLLGRKCVTLATGVVQVFLAKNPTNSWQKKCTGVCCFVKDNPKRSYYIRVYNLKNESMIWEQELYNQFKYLFPRPYFCTFDTDNCRAALNFASEKEALKFKQIIEEKVRHKQDRRAKTTRGSMRGPPSPRPLPTSPPTGPQHLHQAPPPPKAAQPTPNILEVKAPPTKSESKKSKKKKKGKLTKADISMPSGFKHVNHVGFDPNSGVYDMNEMDPDMKDLIQSVGMTEQEVKEDKEKVDFIYDFIAKSGGMEAVKKETRALRDSAPPPPPPGRAQPPPPPSRLSPSGPPPPQRLGKAPPPPNRVQSGRPSRNEPPPPPPPSIKHSAPAPPKPFVAAPSANAPPPPPPPPAPGPGAPAPPPPPPSGGNLMSQIQQGASLRSANDRAPSPAAGDGGGRNDLLAQIRKGTDLKKVSTEDVDDRAAPPSDGGGGGLANALADALRKREQHIQVSDQEDDDEDSDEWSD